MPPPGQADRVGRRSRSPPDRPQSRAAETRRSTRGPANHEPTGISSQASSRSLHSPVRWRRARTGSPQRHAQADVAEAGEGLRARQADIRRLLDQAVEDARGRDGSYGVNALTVQPGN